MSAMPSEYPNYPSDQVEPDRAPLRPASIPEFEGNKVHRTKAQFTSASNLEVADEVYRLDEVKRFYVEAKVVDVRHKVNEKSGELDRVQVLKVVDVQPITWDTPDAWKP